MSATTVPTTWQEAFENHSVSSVRTLEKQLHAGALRDKEKLRVIVGSNYRDLLATAEQIVQLNTDARDAEVSISSLSQACKPPMLQPQSTAIPIKPETAGQLKLLDQLLRCASRAVKQQMVLLASKMLIIARLLLKHLEDKHGSTGVAKWVQSRLRSVRSQLTSRINKILLKPSTSLDDLLQCCGAYCLLTGSSCTDAVKHFQNVRLQRLALTENSTDSSRDLKQSCHYLIVSAIAIKAVSGRSLVELLNDLQKRPILGSDELRSLEILQLDVNQDLLPQDIISFVPYFKRSTPSKSALRSGLEQWVDDAMKHVLHRIQAVLANAKLLKTLKIRQEVLDILLPNCFSSALYGKPLDSVRDLFSKVIVERIEQSAGEMTVLGQKFGELSEVTSNRSLWTSGTKQNSNIRQTSAHLRKIQQQHLGITGELDQYIRSLSHWSRRMQTGKEAIQNLSKVKWQEKLEDYDDESEAAAHEIISTLSKEDIQNFTAKFNELLQQKASEMMNMVGEQVSNAAEAPVGKAEDEGSSRMTVMLRALREIRALLKVLLPDMEFPVLAEATTRLFQCLAQRVSGELFTAREKDDPESNSSSFVPDDLPSPLTISLLQELCTIMLKNGGHDLWSATAVRMVSRIVFEHIMSQESRKFYIANEFDEHYLYIALGGGASGEGGAKSEVGHRRAAAYWNRTKTLFGILNL